MHEDGIDLEFYKEAIKRFDDDEAFPALFNDAIVTISTKLGTISMEDEYKQYVQVLPDLFLNQTSNRCTHPNLTSLSRL